jgi:hypothetical protein
MRNKQAHIYRFRNMTREWKRKYQVVQRNKYCRFYTLSKYKPNGGYTLDSCANYIRQKNPELQYFGFRLNSNWWCHGCKMFYKGEGDSKMTVNESVSTYGHIYRIIHWKPPTYKW